MTDPLGAYAGPATAHAHFAARLAFETDVSDVAAVLGTSGVVVFDVRDRTAWDAGHVPGAVHLPHAEIRRGSVPPADRYVVYCWGPACNGAVRGAVALSALGLPVKEMLGGFEYWVREGLPVETADGVDRRTPDLLTTAAGVACGC